MAVSADSWPTIPGVLLRVDGLGVLLQGDSGSGKSDLALGLLERGHQLVADDAVELRSTPDGLLNGRCPQALRGLLEVRGLGPVNVATLFGPAALADETAIVLVVELQRPDAQAWRNWPRLQGRWQDIQLLDQMRPCLQFPSGAARPMPQLLETAVRHWRQRPDQSTRGGQPDA